MFIYLISNKINGMRYVGLTKKNVNQRISEHISAKTYIGNALRKYGIQSFDISIIDNTESVDVLKEKERYWIKFCNCKVPFGYNLTDGGDGVFGYKHTPERRKKISEGGLGLKRSEETKRKMSVAQKGNKSGLGNKSRSGLHMSDEAKKKISEFNLGKKLSEEIKQKISITRKKKNLGAGNKYALGVNVGKKLSESHKQLIREGNIKAWKFGMRKINEQTGHNNYPVT